MTRLDRRSELVMNDPNRIARIEVVMADGSRLVVMGAIEGHIDVRNEIMDTGVTPGGFITREPTGRATLAVVAHVDRHRGDTLEWCTKPLVPSCSVCGEPAR